MALYQKLAGFEITLVDAAGRGRGVGRSPGLHLSDIIKRKELAHGIVKEDIEGEQKYVRMFMGFTFERAMDYAFREMMQLSLALHEDALIELGSTQLYTREQIRPQFEFIADGYAGTPDVVNDGWSVLESFKLTWKSQAKFEDPFLRAQHFWHWEMAEMEYCYQMQMLQTLYFIGWVGGDYKWKKGTGPNVQPYLATYTKEELALNHADVLYYRDICFSEGWEPARRSE